jgi:hypothetical protein
MRPADEVTLKRAWKLSHAVRRINFFQRRTARDHSLDAFSGGVLGFVPSSAIFSTEENQTLSEVEEV